MIKRLWNDEGVQQCFQRSNEYQLGDSARYFLDALDRIAAPNYKQTFEDILQAHSQTTGVIEYPFSYRGLNYRMVDTGGTRSKRRKWIHAFDNFTSIVYCFALSEYDLNLFESVNENRLEESFNLLKTMSHYPMLKDTPFFLFLNKTDVFAEKIQKSPLTDYFPEYAGSNTYEEASAYIRDQLESVCGHKQIYTYFTCAIDTNNFKAVFDLVNDVIVKNNLQKYGIF